MNTIGQQVLPINGQRETDNGKRVKQAAEQFEALMMSELLKTAREAGSDGGWLGTEDEAGQTNLDMAEQQVATVMAKAGGLGLRDLITRGLQQT
jgi:peptidoglycan hydrolase FlgJ